MSNKKFCLQCGRQIDFFEKKCKYCGTNQYGKNNEYYPSDKFIRKVEKQLKKQSKQRDEGLSEEEILALGLYPKDESYKLSLISIILGKK